MKKIFLFLALLLLAGHAHAQTQVYQSGTITAGDPAIWTTNRYIGDGALNSGFSRFLITATTPTLCVNDAVTTGAYHQLCLGALNAAGTGGTLLYSALGGASALPYIFSVNSGTISFNGSAITLGTAASVAGTLNVAGTSGSNAILTQNQLVLGGSTSGTFTQKTAAVAGSPTFIWPITSGTAGQPLLSGAGSAASTWGSLSGNTTTFVTQSGASVSGHCPQYDASGNVVDSGASCASSGVTAGTAGNVTYYATTGSAVAPNLDLNMSNADLTIGRAAVSQGSISITGAGGGFLKTAVPASVTSYTLTMPSAVGASGQVLQATNGTGTLAWKYPGAACCTNQTANFNAAVNTWYSVDTTAGAVTMTLPASPANGDKVQWSDAKNKFATSNLVVARNGNTIMNVAENMTVSTNNANAGLVWDSTNSTWSLY